MTLWEQEYMRAWTHVAEMISLGWTERECAEAGTLMLRSKASGSPTAIGFLDALLAAYGD
jgi:hypothetical protein